MDIGVPELLIILVIIILLFGVGRIGKVAGEMGKGIRAFREGLKGEDEKKPEPEVKPEVKPEPMLEAKKEEEPQAKS
jgi:sec-independent protein translocase protein TatA